MSQIPHQKRLQVVDELLQGKPYAAVADQLGISKSTVSKIVDEVVDGEYEEIPGAKERWSALRELSKKLDKQDESVTEALLGAKIFQRLTDFGIEVPDLHHSLKDITSFIDQLETEEVPPDEYLTAAVELSQLEDETGMAYDELVDEYEDRQEEVAAIESDIEAANQRKEQAESERDTAITEAEATKADLSAYREFRASAADHGLAIDETLDGVLALLETYGIEELEQITGLNETLEAVDMEAESAQAALQQCQSILDCGFTSDQAEVVAEALRRRDEGFDASLDRLVDQLDTHEELAAATRSLEQREGEVTERIESLETRIDTKQQTIDELQERVDSLRDTESQLEATTRAIRKDVEGRRTEKQRLEREINDLGFEADAILSVLGFLKTQKVSPMLARTLQNLVQMNHGAAQHLELSRSSMEQRIEDWLVEQLHEFTEGTEAIAKRKHEEKIAELEAELERREAAETERSLEETRAKLEAAEKEVNAARSLMEFVVNRSVSEELLEELLWLKREGSMAVPDYLRRKEDELESEMLEAINFVVDESDAVIRVEECETRIAEERERTREDLQFPLKELQELGVLKQGVDLRVKGGTKEEP